MKSLAQGHTRVKRPAPLLEWHRWFAWYPVPTATDGKLKYAWLQSVERKWGIGRYSGTIKWRYRLLRRSRSMTGDSDHQSPDELTARIVQRLRDVEIGCEIINLVPTQTAVLRRDRIIIILALALLTGLAWSYLLWPSADMSMGGMDMTGLRMIPSGMGLMIPAEMPWRAMEFPFVFAMWTVMMVGMMTPSAAPMILMYARMGRQTQAHGRPLVVTVWFAAGYFLVWAAFSLFATLVQWAFERIKNANGFWH